MKTSTFLAFALCAVSASAHVLFDRTTQPLDWQKMSRASPDTEVSFLVAMRQSNLDSLDKKFWAVNTPGSPYYGQFMTRQEVQKLTATPQEVVDRVKGHFSELSCDLHTLDSLKCVGTADKVEAAFKTELYTFQHLFSSLKIVRHFGQMAIPDELNGDIEFVTGLSTFPIERFGRSKPLEENPDYLVVPETIVNFYKLQNAQGSNKVTQAAAEFQNYPAFSNSDLSTFIQKTSINSFDIKKTIGPFDQSNPQAESTLDVQYLGAVGAGNNNWYWTESQWMYDFTQNILSASSVPDVISMSYGWDEAQQCQISSQECSRLGINSQQFVQRVNTEFQKIGATGVTLVASAGDAGAHGRTDEFCFGKKTNPTFPAASPYLTAVGATQIADGTSAGANAPICSEQQCATGGTEVVASKGTGALITSGGGFSNVADMPSYQKTVVEKYLKNSDALPGTGNFNANGRGYPDVAALGHKYYIELNGQAVQVDGTSCSAPVFSGVLSLLNAYRAENGKANIGFANPLLYSMYSSHPNAFNDVTEGNNKCTEETCGCTGFSAVEGWDAVTGLGTPNFPAMLSALQEIDSLNEPSAKLMNMAKSMLRGVTKN